MKARVDAGSDIAAIGAWDAERDSTPLTPAEQKHLSATLEADAAAGHLFLVHTGGDGGGPIDLYIDEPIPGDVRDRFAPAGRECLLVVPSGTLVVDGAEYYRGSVGRNVGRNGSAAVPAGHYAVRCYVPRDEEQPSRSEAALRGLVGSADLAYYDRVNAAGCLVGASTLLLFPILSFPLGWKVALVVTAVVFVSFFHVRQWVLKRNSRYQRLDQVVPAFRLANDDPAFVFELRPIRDVAGLKGGSVSV